jgi:nicotinamide mononucleotide (NMN) deamidase PncC
VPEDPLVDLAERLLDACVARGLTLGTAESCTGGLVAHLITEVPGSSRALLGGIVAYSDEVKRAELAVPADVLDAHGAVSAQVAVAMAEGVRARLATDLGVGVTGGGPSVVRRYLWPGDRSANKRDSARAALELLLAQAIGEASSDVESSTADAAGGAQRR